VCVCGESLEKAKSSSHHLKALKDCWGELAMGVVHLRMFNHVILDSNPHCHFQPSTHKGTAKQLHHSGFSRRELRPCVCMRVLWVVDVSKCSMLNVVRRKVCSVRVGRMGGCFLSKILVSHAAAAAAVAFDDENAFILALKRYLRLISSLVRMLEREYYYCTRVGDELLLMGIGDSALLSLYSRNGPSLSCPLAICSFMYGFGLKYIEEFFLFVLLITTPRNASTFRVCVVVHNIIPVGSFLTRCYAASVRDVSN